MEGDGGLVGRRAELTALRSAVDKAARGTGGAVFVLGEAGIGKSRLLAAAVERARAAGMAVLTGRAVAGGGAYRAVAAALAEHLRDRAPTDEGLRPFLPALRRLLPAWTPDGTDAAPVDEADPTVVLGEGVLLLLRLVAADRGCLLALEDLHWADADTLALVEYLAEAAGSAGVLLVASARDDGPRGLGRLGVPVLRPQRLSATETAALVGAHAAHLPADRLDFVVATADGLPLLVEELVRQDRPGVPPTFAAVRHGRSDAAAAAAHFADGDRIAADTPWWHRLLRMLALHAALADGWAAQVDAVGALRADLAEHERLGDHQLARTCRDLLRRAGAPTRPGRGATPVPAALRAVGVTGREMDVLVLVADGLSNAEVAERLFLSPRTVETHVANLLAKTGSAHRAQLRALTP